MCLTHCRQLGFLWQKTKRVGLPMQVASKVPFPLMAGCGHTPALTKLFGPRGPYSDSKSETYHNIP